MVRCDERRYFHVRTKGGSPQRRENVGRPAEAGALRYAVRKLSRIAAERDKNAAVMAAL